MGPPPSSTVEPTVPGGATAGTNVLDGDAVIDGVPPGVPVGTGDGVTDGDAPVERDAEPVEVAVPDTVEVGVAAPSGLRASKDSGTASATTRMRSRQHATPTTARRFTRGGAEYRYTRGPVGLTRLGSSETNTTSAVGETPLLAEARFRLGTRLGSSETTTTSAGGEAPLLACIRWPLTGVSPSLRRTRATPRGTLRV